MQNFRLEVTADGKASRHLHGEGLRGMRSRESVAFSEGHRVH